MRFIFVNGRMPRVQSFCALCCQPIGASYLRELETRFSFCDDKCYGEHCRGAVSVLENHAGASRVTIDISSADPVFGTPLANIEPIDGIQDLISGS